MCTVHTTCCMNEWRMLLLLLLLSRVPMVGAMQTSSTGGGGTEPDHFMEIWAHNLDEGFDKIRLIVQKYPYIAMVSAMLHVDDSLNYYYYYY